MHELLHILQNHTAIDGSEESSSIIEKRCDKFAGEVLMPADSALLKDIFPRELSEIKILAKKFNVSSYACLVRLRQLKKISRPVYKEYEKIIKDELELFKRAIKKTKRRTF